MAGMDGALTIETEDGAVTDLVTDVDICNRALLEIGASPITSMTDSDARSVACFTLYPPTFRWLLRLHPWNFAISRTELDMVVDVLGDPEPPAWGFSYQYDLPPDFLRLLDINEGVELDKAYKLEGARLLTDESSVSIRYISRTIPAFLCDDLFCACLVAALASKLAGCLKENSGLAKEKFDELKALLPSAKTVDGQEGSPDTVDSNDLTKVRW